MKTVAICIVGTEILKGQLTDTNSQFLSKSLHKLGFDVKKTCIIPDELSCVVSEIKNLKTNHDIVIITGESRCLHDDIIYEGVASIFNVPLVINDQLTEIRMKLHPENTNNEQELLPVKIPDNSKILECNFEYCTPIVQVENVFIFPGCRLSVEHRFKNMEYIFRNLSDGKFFTKVICLKCPDIALSIKLNKIKEKFNNTVNIWSCPCDTYEKSTEISIESTSLQDVVNCEAYLKQKFCKCYKTSNKFYCHVDEVYDAAKHSTSIKNAIHVIEECYSKYSPSDVFLSFNGGKDCTVLLHLVIMVGLKIFANKFTLKCLYVKPDESFEEVEHFIEETIQYYSLDLITMNCDIKKALGNVLESNSNFKAVLMGTRKTDPYSENLNSFQITDKNWPQVMRVSPLLEWNYSDIWNYLRNLNIPYCSLYDQGFTSLGSKINTQKNPALLINQQYLPAYMLRNGDYERSGRNSKPNQE